MKFKDIVLFIFIFISSRSIYSQEWESDIFPSYLFFDGADYLPHSVPSGFSFSSLVGAGNSAQSGIPIGPSFTMNAYFFIPEKETSFFWNTGVNWINQTFGQKSSNTISSESFFQPYTNISLNQVLLGDRYRRTANFNITLQHRSSLYSSIDEEAEGHLFFRHTPVVNLNIITIEDPFWSVLGLNANIALPLDLGHLIHVDSFWSFFVVFGDLNVKLPIISNYLYFDWVLLSEIVLIDFIPQVDIPNYVYTNYTSPYHFKNQLDLKSRLIEFDPLYPMAVELGIFIMVDYAIDQNSTEAFLSLPLKIGAYGEFKIEIPQLMNLSVKAGAIYNISTKKIGFYFQI